MWKAKIEYGICDLNSRLYIYRESGDRVELLLADGKVETLPSNGVVTAPSMIIPQGAQGAVLEALLAAGVRPKEQSLAEGMLKAQGEHLQDLRHLLKLPPK